MLTQAEVRLRREVYPVSLLCITKVNIDSTDLVEYMGNIHKQIVDCPFSTIPFYLEPDTCFGR
jgi:hypothetical protein